MRTGAGTGTGNRGESCGSHRCSCLIDQWRRNRSTRHTNRERLTQSKQLVIPAFADFDERELREIRVLLSQERANQRLVDHDLGSRLLPDAHLAYDRIDGADHYRAASRANQ
jgi:hypothetical protein